MPYSEASYITLGPAPCSTNRLVNPLDDRSVLNRPPWRPSILPRVACLSPSYFFLQHNCARSAAGEASNQRLNLVD